MPYVINVKFQIVNESGAAVRDESVKNPDTTKPEQKVAMSGRIKGYGLVSCSNVRRRV
jgi:hypothetical protein